MVHAVKKEPAAAAAAAAAANEGYTHTHTHTHLPMGPTTRRAHFLLGNKVYIWSDAHDIDK